MAMFTSRKQEPVTPTSEPPRAGGPDSNRAPTATPSGGLLSGGVSIKGSVKFRNALLIDGAKSVQVRGTIDGNIFASERCELGPGCTLRGDIEAPRLVVDENATFLGSAKIATK
jgi:cytoskeletal protein CcmA (bactofilin family)